jgi:hypothetical protein
MQMRAAQNQNELAQYQLGAARRTDEQQSALNALARDPNFNPNTPEGMRQAQQFGAPGYALVKSAREASSAGVAQNEAQAKLALEKQKHLGQMYRDISSRPSDANITAHAEDVEASPMYTPEEKTAVRAKADRLLAMPMADRMTMLSQQGATAGELRPQVVTPGASLVAPGANKPYFTAPKETPTYAPSADQQGYETAQNQGYRGTFLDYKRELALASRTPAQPRAESAPVPVVDPATGKPILVSRERAIAEGMTPASAQEGLPAKEIQKREAALPKSTAAIKMVEDSTDKLIAQMQLLRNHPGLSGITGLIMGITPALTSSARSAQAILDTIKAKGTLSVLTAVRNASATGGALGNTSNKDIDLLERGFGALKTTQSTDDFKTQIGNVISDLEASKLRAREAYDDTYAYKTTAPAAAPAAAPSANAAKGVWGQSQVVNP